MVEVVEVSRVVAVDLPAQKMMELLIMVDQTQLLNPEMMDLVQGVMEMKIVVKLTDLIKATRMAMMLLIKVRTRILKTHMTSSLEQYFT
jgi:hypothetical protein